MPDPFIKRVNRDRYACGREDADEIVADGSIHLERMAADHVWIGLYKDGGFVHVNLHSDSPITVLCEPDEEGLVLEENWNNYAGTWEEEARKENETMRFDPEAKIWTRIIVASLFPQYTFILEMADDTRVEVLIKDNEYWLSVNRREFGFGSKDCIEVSFAEDEGGLFVSKVHQHTDRGRVIYLPYINPHQQEETTEPPPPPSAPTPTR